MSNKPLEQENRVYHVYFYASEPPVGDSGFHCMIAVIDSPLTSHRLSPSYC